MSGCGLQRTLHRRFPIIWNESAAFSACNVKRQRAGRGPVVTGVSSRAAPTQRVHLCLEYGQVQPCPHMPQRRPRPSLRLQGHGPRAAPSPLPTLVPGVAGKRRVSEKGYQPCPSRAAATVGWPLIAAQVGATSVWPLIAAPVWARASPGPRPWPSPETGRLPNAAYTRPLPRFLGPGDRSGGDAPRHPASSGALARPGPAADPWLVGPCSD